MKDVFDLGLEVDKLREEAGLTQKELAARAGLHISTLSVIINGGAIPREMTLGKLAKVLPLDLEEWLEPVRRYQWKPGKTVRRCPLRRGGGRGSARWRRQSAGRRNTPGQV